MTRSRRRPQHPRYEISERLAAGGTSDVFLARDRIDGSSVALKICRDAAAPTRFTREFRVLRDLRHPAIVQALDFGVMPDSGSAYVALEHVEGRSLDEEIKSYSRPLSADDRAHLVRVLAELADALVYIHRRRILHLDLKPSNMILATAGVRLIDFGFVEDRERQPRRIVHGTPRYAAPEILAGRPADERSDLFSVGVTMYRALTGRYPYTRTQLESSASGDVPAAPRRLRAETDALDAIVLRLVAWAPEDRFPRAEALADALAEAFPDALAATRAAGSAEFIGRRAELDRFLEWLDSFTTGDAPAPLVIRGETGIGKTRFIDRCTTELLSTGVNVFSVPAKSRREFDTLRRLVQQVLALSPATPDALDARFGFLLSVLGLAEDPTRLDELRDFDVEQIRSRIFREFFDLLDESTAERLTIVSDNADLADPHWRALVERVLHGGVPAPLAGRVGWIVSTRDAGEIAGGDALDLSPLDPEETLALSTALLPRADDDVRRRHAETARGNPGFLAQLVRRSTPLPSGSLAGGADLARVLRLEFLNVERDEQDVVICLSLLGRPSTTGELARITGSAEDDVDHRIDALVAVGLVERRGTSCDLGHDVLDAETISTFAPDRVPDLHARIGEALVESRADSREAARHLLRSPEVERGLAVGREALDALKQSGRVHSALDLCAEMLEHGSTMPGDQRLTLLEEEGDLAQKAGRLDSALESYDKLLDETDLQGLARVRAQRKKGGALQRSGQSDAAHSALLAALHSLDPADAPASPATLDEELHLANELAAFHLYRGEFAQSTTFANRGLEVLASDAARAIDEPKRALHALNLHSIAGHIYLRQFEYERSTEQFEKALEHSGDRAALPSSALILNNLGVAYQQWNRIRRALDVYERARKVAQLLGDDTAVFSIQCNVAGVRARLGQLSLADELLEVARAMPICTSSRRARLFFLYTRALTARLAGIDAGEQWREVVALADELPDPLFAGYARVHSLENEIFAGRFADARRIAESVSGAGDARRQRAVDLRLAYLDAVCGHRRSAETILARWSKSMSLRDDAGSDSAFLWDTVIFAGALIELGELDGAKEKLEFAAGLFDELGEIPGRLECALQLADLYLRSRDGDAAERSLGDARQALALHDTSFGSRDARRRLLFLEIRSAVLAGARSRSRLPAPLRRAVLEDSLTGVGELEWLVLLTATEGGVSGLDPRLKAARDAFVAGLGPHDRASYLQRDQRRRLGLAPAGDALTTRETERSAQQLGSLYRLRSAKEFNAAFDLALEAIGAESVAIVVETSGGGRKLLHARSAGRSSLTGELDLNSLTADGSRCGDWLSVELPRPDERRPSFLCAEVPRDGNVDDDETIEFLHLVAHFLVRLLPRVSPTDRGENGDSTRLLRPGTPPDPNAEIVAESPVMREIVTLIERTRDSNLPVLISGESGVGKDFIARRVHARSQRANEAFVAQDCSAIPEGLFEAELFGAVAGAFTGATEAREGCLVAADGGTFYLDGIDSLPLEAQAKLLRVLETGEIRPLGSAESLSIDIRVVSSARRNLKDLSARGEFRRDLYFRVAGICLELPPLRERTGDIPGLVQAFQREIAESKTAFTAPSIEALKAYSWPGNVRELESLVRRLALTVDGSVEPEHVRDALGIARDVPQFPTWIFEDRDYREVMDAVKREYLLHLFDRYDGDLARVAEAMGTTKRNVYLRFQQVGLKPTELRNRRSS